MAMRTIVLKLHKPGRCKQKIIDEALLNYTLAYQYLLEKAMTQMDQIEQKYRGANGAFSAKNIEKWVSGTVSKELNRFGIECFKDSLKMDFSMTMASYLRLREIREDASYPVMYFTKEKWEAEYDGLTDKLIDGSITAKQYDKEVEKINEKSMALKPVFFCRCALNRDFCLLYDEENNRYFAKLYLMNVKSSNRSTIEAKSGKVLKHIHENGELLEASNRKERFIIVPLSFGQWQEQYLRKALENPGMIKTARLTKKDKEYYLSINIQLEDLEKVKTASFMGVARGIRNLINYTIVDPDGEIICAGAIGNKNGSPCNGMSNVGEVHRIANTIVDIALQNKAQVITQPFTNMGDRLQYADESGDMDVPAMNCQDYNKLNSILKYKLAGKGLPQPVETSPVGVFHTCPMCGLHSLQNRFSKDMLICIACGTAMDIECLGSLNLAQRLIKYNKTPIEIKVEKMPDGVKFINSDLGLDYKPSDPMNFIDEFRMEIQRLVEEFHLNIGERSKSRDFKRVYSLVKRFENTKDFTKLIKVVE